MQKLKCYQYFESRFGLVCANNSCGDDMHPYCFFFPQLVGLYPFHVYSE